MGLREGHLVRHRGGPVMKVVLLWGEDAQCAWVDALGRVVHEWHARRELLPWHVGQRSAWT